MTTAHPHHLHPVDVIEYARALTAGEVDRARQITTRAGWEYADHVLAPLRVSVALVGATCPAENGIHGLALHASSKIVDVHLMREFEALFDDVVNQRLAAARQRVDDAPLQYVGAWTLIATSGLVAVYGGGGFRPAEVVEIPDTVPDSWAT